MAPEQLREITDRLELNNELSEAAWRQLDDERIEYINAVGDILGQDDNESLEEVATRVIKERDAFSKDTDFYQDQAHRLRGERAILSDALQSLAAVARRYLPDYDEHPEIQKADEALTHNAKLTGGGAND